MKLIFLNSLLIISAVVSIAGDISAKTWTLNRKPVLFVAAMAAYIIASLLWLVFLRDVRLSMAIPWWQAMVAVPAILAGVWYFQERLSIIEIAAVAMIIAGVIILNLRHA